MRLIPSLVVLVLAQIVAASCASVPVPATKGASSPASPEAAEGRLERLDLFPASEALNSGTQAASPSPAMAGMDHSMPGMEGGSQAATPLVSAPTKAPDANASEETYTCVMHPQITEPKPGKCPICGMPLVKKPKEKK